MYDIYLKDITLIKNQRKLLADINAHFPRNKTTVIIGPSGSGKSTLLKVAAALLPIDSGSVLLNDKNLKKLKSPDILEFRKNSSFVFQDAALWANESVYRNLILPLNLHYSGLSNKDKDQRIKEILEKVGYTDSLTLRPAALSNGEREMVSLARALITSPKLIYMDNPLVLADPAVAKKMKKLIVNLNKSEATIIANFSSASLINQIADYLYVMKDGKLVETGTKIDVLNSSNPLTISIIDSLLKHNPN
jgi:phospholipid/cholesterol/gamma-HCH transport system ATP-binding protein